MSNFPYFFVISNCINLSWRDKKNIQIKLNCVFVHESVKKNVFFQIEGFIYSILEGKKSFSRKFTCRGHRSRSFLISRKCSIRRRLFVSILRHHIVFGVNKLKGRSVIYPTIFRIVVSSLWMWMRMATSVML